MHVLVAFIKNAQYKAIKGRFDKTMDSGWWCIESRSPDPSPVFYNEVRPQTKRSHSCWHL